MVAEMNGRVAHITALKHHVSDTITTVQTATILCLSPILMKDHRQADTMVLGVLPCTVVDKLFMETEIASVLKIRGDLAALRVQGIGAELHAWAQGSPTL